MPSIATTDTRPYIAHVWDSTGATFKETLTPLNIPTLGLVLNGIPSALTLQFAAPLVGAQAPVKGDRVVLTEDGGDGTAVYTGIVEDLPDDLTEASHAYSMLLEPLGAKLGRTPFETNYTASTDTGQMCRDAATAAGITWDSASIPLSGINAIYDFSGASSTCLTVFEEARKMSGPMFGYRVDENGKAYFRLISLAAAATHSIRIGPQAVERKRSQPIGKRVNIIKANGAVVSGVVITATYDNSAGSPLGKRVLIPTLQYPKVTDHTTLVNMVNTFGAGLDREFVTVTIKVVGYGTRIEPGDTLRYYEESVDERGLPVSALAGSFTTPLVVQTVGVLGPVQSVTCSDIAITVDDIKNELAAQANRVAGSAAGAVVLGAPGVITPGMTGGSVPSTVAGLAAATSIENVAHVNNAIVTLTWTPNAGTDYVTGYEVRWRIGAGAYSYAPAINAGATIRGLVQGVAYGFSARAINIAGTSAWSSEVVETTAAKTTADAVPTGLVAAKSPRGAIVKWAANTEADLQGYELQVSINGGGYVAVTNGPTLATIISYVAPAGTAIATPLAFQVRSVDDSGNRSAWSAASAAVNTDGIVADEITAGSINAAIILAGSIYTSATGHRAGMDNGGIYTYDATATDYGAGAGVTFKAPSDGSAAFFKGIVGASGFKGGYVFLTSADLNLPAEPSPPITNGVGSMLLDSVNGLRAWVGNGSIADPLVNWNFAAGTLTIYKNASIYASTMATSSAVGDNTPTPGFKLGASKLEFWITSGPTENLRAWEWANFSLPGDPQWYKGYAFKWAGLGSWKLVNNAGTLASWAPGSRLLPYLGGFIAHATAAQVIPATTLTQLTMTAQRNAAGQFSDSNQANGSFASNTWTPGQGGIALVTARVSISTSISRMYIALYAQGSAVEAVRGEDATGNGQTTSAVLSAVVDLAQWTGPFDFRVWCSNGATTEYSTDHPVQVHAGAVILSSFAQ